GVVSFLAWVFIWLRPSRPWDMRPVAEDDAPPPDPAAWPSVRVVVPARNEAATLPRTIPSLAGQDYPGEWRVVVVDDRSEDGTAESARSTGGTRTTVLPGAALPEGWVGKVWAMQQGVEGATEDYILLTDADILHAPGSLRHLVRQSVQEHLSL